MTLSRVVKLQMQTQTRTDNDICKNKRKKMFTTCLSTFGNFKIWSIPNDCNEAVEKSQSANDFCRNPETYIFMKVIVVSSKLSQAHKKIQKCVNLKKENYRWGMKSVWG